MSRDEVVLNSNREQKTNQLKTESFDRKEHVAPTIHSEELRYKNADEIYE
ncbi:hypothetical protein ACFYKX_05860 [Cytobacillus sp. FJAT-54145]|uniref:Uncharacterized protein n=1 Tax=Cytobacillus spartinae TaxID=3299023 RepID=A0ABW6K8T5_9BACI